MADNIQFDKPLIRIVNLKKYFPIRKTKLFQKEVLTVKANDGINLTIHEGETLGLVGESGCGKSTLGRVLLQLYPLTEGKVFYYGRSLQEFAPNYLRKDIAELPRFKRKHLQLTAEIAEKEKQLAAMHTNPEVQAKLNEYKKEITRLAQLNESIKKESKEKIGAFIENANIKEVKKAPHFDSKIQKLTLKIDELKNQIKLLETAHTEIIKNPDKELTRQLEEINKQLEVDRGNLEIQLNKKKLVVERKLNSPRIDIEQQLRKKKVLLNDCTVLRSYYINFIKNSIDNKELDLNETIVKGLVDYKIKHYMNEMLIKKYEDLINFTKEKNHIAHLKHNLEALFDRTGIITGAYVLADNVDECRNVLLTHMKLKLKHKKYSNYKKAAEIIILKNNKLLEDNKDVYSKAEKKLLEQKNINQQKRIAKFDEILAKLNVELERYKQLIKEKKNELNGKPLFDELENRRDKGVDLTRLNTAEMNSLRQDLQIIFQDPYSSLNPRMTIGQIIGEGIQAHKIDKYNEKNYQQLIEEAMDECGVAPYMIHRYPHQFSGGQRQRIGIARSLALHPKFIVCDEAVSALDVSIQSQIINLLEDLRDQNNLTYLFISHDLSVIKHISNRIGVMYLGNIVELASSDDIYANPLHPYTKALISAIPTTDQRNKKKIILEGDIPSNVFPPSGCKFRTRCPIACKQCAKKVPELREVEPGRFVACHFYEKTKDITAQ